MITSLITFAVMSALPLLLATAVAVLSHDPQRRADARRVVVLLRRDHGKRKTRHWLIVDKSPVLGSARRRGT